MGFGLLDSVGGLLFGGVPSASRSGAFPGAKELGRAAQEYLLGRLQTPAAESMQFQLGSQAIRDSLSQSAGAARQRLGDLAVNRGFMDSGAVTAGMLDIERTQASTYASQINNLLLALEESRMNNVLPFLGAASSENTAIQGMNMQAELARENLLGSMYSGLFSALAG